MHKLSIWQYDKLIINLIKSRAHNTYYWTDFKDYLPFPSLQADQNNKEEMSSRFHVILKRESMFLNNGTLIEIVLKKSCM